MIYKNSGLTLAMESALASAKTIVSATNAAPGVFTSTAHGYIDGDIIYAEVDGMIEAHKRLFVVVNKTTDTLQLKNTATGAVGIDTTLWGVFTAGTFKKITLGTNIPGVESFTASGGEAKFVSTTTVNDVRDKQEVVGATPMSYALLMQWDPSDTAQIAMQAALLTMAAKGFKITWPNGRYALFYGTVGYNGAPGGDSQGVTTSPAAIAMAGIPTYGIP